MLNAKISNPSLRNFLFAAVAAGATTFAVGAMPTPALAETAVVTPGTAQAWQANVEKQIDANLLMPAGGLGRVDHAIAHVRVRFNAEGEAGQISLAQSSGDKAVDAEALRTARSIRYPLLPTAMRGRDRNILMQVYFSDGSSERHAQEAADLQMAAHRFTEQMRIQTAARDQ